MNVYCEKCKTTRAFVYRGEFHDTHHRRFEWYACPVCGTIHQYAVA